MDKKKKKAVKKKTAKKRPVKAPRKVVTVQSRTTTVGKARRNPSKNAGYYMRQAKNKLYDELGALSVRKEKATKKTDKKKIVKKITEKRRQIARLK